MLENKFTHTCDGNFANHSLAERRLPPGAGWIIKAMMYNSNAMIDEATGLVKAMDQRASALPLEDANGLSGKVEGLRWKPARAGVTILEVLFATGIAVFGLVGIASLLTVAGRQASDSNNWTEGQAAAQNALSEFVVRGFNNTALWSAFNDQVTGAYPTHFAPFQTFSHSLPRNTSVGGMRTDNRHAVCIDPYYFANATTQQNVKTAFADTQRYRPGLFPYFQDNFNPLDPSTPLTGNAGRLLRVNLLNPTGGLLSAKTADRLFQLQDDLETASDDSDKTLSVERRFDDSLAQGSTLGQFSWFATLCPRESTSSIETAVTAYPESMYTLSVVICKRRDRAFFVPSSSEEGPLGERVVAVTPAADFKGGSGGRVTLSASRDPLEIDFTQQISDSLRPGDWLMLCRELPLPSGGLMTICRWYRVLTLDVETDTTAGTSWSRNVILDGPDWVFDFTGTYPTQATLVGDVVTVVERVIPIR